MKIVQITDSHLFEDDATELRGIQCNRVFNQVIDKVLKEDRDADMVFLTGDLSEDQTVGSYQKLLSSFATWDVPVYWVPGNHDHLPLMEKTFKKNKNFNRVLRLSMSNWDFIFLDTTFENKAEGHLSSEELSLLNDGLTASKNAANIAIVMHHHPAPVNTPLIDQYILQNANDFWNTVATAPLELVMCGHVHNDYQINHQQVMIETSPATCMQFRKGTTDLIIDQQMGYKVYHFDEKGYRAVAKML